MKVDYDSEGHSLLFEFGEFRHFEEGDHVEELSGGTCLVWVHGSAAGSIQLLGADKDITPLDEAAERFELDADALRAAARAALAAPDREIKIEVGARRLLGTEAKAV
ncbi:MAG TPA: hypothetical protein VHA80_04465 [Solirubrobacterales bacterium]|nr:hypothetical protein [Solirubrobacterales bacterium]HVY96358.1 hypothetical protein [Solirubrobacterales bacterium]